MRHEEFESLVFTPEEGSVIDKAVDYCITRYGITALSWAFFTEDCNFDNVSEAQKAHSLYSRDIGTCHAGTSIRSRGREYDFFVGSIGNGYSGGRGTDRSVIEDFFVNLFDPDISPYRDRIKEAGFRVIRRTDGDKTQYFLLIDLTKTPVLLAFNVLQFCRLFKETTSGRLYPALRDRGFGFLKTYASCLIAMVTTEGGKVVLPLQYYGGHGCPVFSTGFYRLMNRDLREPQDYELDARMGFRFDANRIWSSQSKRTFAEFSKSIKYGLKKDRYGYETYKQIPIDEFVAQVNEYFEKHGFVFSDDGAK